MSEAPTPAPAIVAPALAVIGGALASLLPSWAGLPILLYDPVGRAFRLASVGAPGGPTVEISFYGTYAVALVAFVVAGALGAALRERLAGAARLLAAWAITALVLAAAYQVWSVWP